MNAAFHSNALAPGVRHANRTDTVSLALCADRRYDPGDHLLLSKPCNSSKQPRLDGGWSDEFNGPDGSSVDRNKWVVETGGEGWGNQELEYYTDRSENVGMHDGSLVIRALEENYTGPDGVKRNYTSARLKTFGKFSQTYGRFEARIKIPYGQGMWPAFWMLGDDIDKVGWPACGEIDIMENIGKEPP